MKNHMIALAAIALLAVTIPAQAGKPVKKAKKFTHETVSIPAVDPKVIAVETAGTQLLLQVDRKGVVSTVHYGANAGNPDALLKSGLNSSRGYTGTGTYPAAGGRFVGQNALHVKYADGNQNTELYYTSHKPSAGVG